jgi:hypothetical protein
VSNEDEERTEMDEYRFDSKSTDSVYVHTQTRLTHVTLKFLYVLLKCCTSLHARRMRSEVLQECIFASSMILHNATERAVSSGSASKFY